MSIDEFIRFLAILSLICISLTNVKAYQVCKTTTKRYPSSTATTKATSTNDYPTTTATNTKNYPKTTTTTTIGTYYIIKQLNILLAE